MPRSAIGLCVLVTALVAWSHEAVASPRLRGQVDERAAIAELTYAGAHEHAHADGTPCPDEGDEPCGPDCPCTCCHGHSLAKAGVTSPHLIAAGDAPRPHPIVKPADLHPVELIRRVFHPPRV